MEGLKAGAGVAESAPVKVREPELYLSPNPTERFDGGDYNYIRPLVTIAPTAIRCELPVNTEIGYTQIDDLALELRKADYQHALIFIAWEHGELDKFAKLLLAPYGGDPNRVPFWSEKDYDAIFVFRIQRQDGRSILAFNIDHEGLSELSDPCQ